MAVVQITKLRALPQRVIDILHRQIGPPGSRTRTPAGIGHTQITHQRGHRQAVRGDMVHHGHQHMFIIGDAEKPRLQRNLVCQVKRVARRRLNGLTQPGRRPAAGINNIPTEIGPLGRHHQLLRYPPGRPKQRAQALMAAHHIGQRRTQRLDIKRAAQPQRHRHVVNR